MNEIKIKITSKSYTVLYNNLGTNQNTLYRLTDIDYQSLNDIDLC